MADNQAAPKKSGLANFLSNLRTGYTNKYFRIVVYALACLLTSCLYFGWQPYSDMLFRNGAYAWLCGPDAEAPDEDSIALCVEQDKAITRLYSLAAGSEFVSAAVAGLLLDQLGPRFTAMLGETLFLIATLLIAFSRQNFQAYIPALILSGACVNIIAFPSLTVIESWPTRQALAVAVIIGAQSGASVVAPILSAIWDRNPSFTYSGIWMVYLVAIWLPVVVVYIWALPARRDFTALMAKSSAIEGAEAGKEAEASVPQPAAGKRGDPTSSSHSHSIPPTMTETEGDAEIALHEPKAEKGVNTNPQAKPNKEIWSAFWRDVKTIDLIVMGVYSLLQMMQFAYYPSVVRDAVSKRISDYVGWMTPLQAVFSVVIGFAMDYTGTCLVMFGMSATLIFVSLSVGYGANRLALQYIVGVVFVFMQSATYNLKYTFVNEMYDPFNFGKLVGLLGILGGVGVYLNIPISSSTRYQLIFTIYVGVALLMAVCTTFLYVRQLRGLNYKTVQGVVQTHRKGLKRPADDNGDDEAATARV